MVGGGWEVWWVGDGWCGRWEMGGVVGGGWVVCGWEVGRVVCGGWVVLCVKIPAMNSGAPPPELEVGSVPHRCLEGHT